MKRALRTTDADLLADQAREAFAAAIRNKIVKRLEKEVGAKLRS